MSILDPEKKTLSRGVLINLFLRFSKTFLSRGSYLPGGVIQQPLVLETLSFHKLSSYTGALWAFTDSPCTGDCGVLPFPLYWRLCFFTRFRMYWGLLSFYKLSSLYWDFVFLLISPCIGDFTFLRFPLVLKILLFTIFPMYWRLWVFTNFPSILRTLSF